MEYEEKVSGILTNLNGIEKMEREHTPAPSSLWSALYKKDVTFLLKELATIRGRTRELNQRLVAAAELATANVSQIKDLRARMGNAIDLLTTPEKK